MRTDNNTRARIRKNRIIALFVGIAVILFCCILISDILKQKKLNEEYEARKERLEEQLAGQEERRDSLDADEDYVKTMDYIEEKAKSIGYVYPDEIIFKRED